MVIIRGNTLENNQLCEEIINKVNKIVSTINYTNIFHKIIFENSVFVKYEYENMTIGDFNDYNNKIDILRPHILDANDMFTFRRLLNQSETRAYAYTSKCLFVNSKNSKSYSAFFTYIVTEQYLKHYYKQLTQGTSMNYAFDIFRELHFALPQYMMDNNITFENYEALRAAYPLSNLIKNGILYNNISSIDYFVAILLHEFKFLHTEYIVLATNFKG